MRYWLAPAICSSVAQLNSTSAACSWVIAGMRVAGALMILRSSLFISLLSLLKTLALKTSVRRTYVLIIHINRRNVKHLSWALIYSMAWNCIAKLTLTRGGIYAYNTLLRLPKGFYHCCRGRGLVLYSMSVHAYTSS